MIYFLVDQGPSGRAKISASSQFRYFVVPFEPDLSRDPAVDSSHRSRAHNRRLSKRSMNSGRWVAAQIRRVINEG